MNLVPPGNLRLPNRGSTHQAKRKRLIFASEGKQGVNLEEAFDKKVKAMAHADEEAVQPGIAKHTIRINVSTSWRHNV